MLARLTRSAAFLFVVSSASAQSTWFVDASAQGPGTGVPGDPFPTISAAIAAATTIDGDTIEVASGIYLDSFDLGGKSIRIVGAPGPRPLIRGNGSDRYCEISSGEGPGTELARLDFQAGRGGLAGGQGGALFVSGSTVLLTDCVFRDCSTCSSGGAVYAVNAVLDVVDCEFTNNRGSRGGALDAHVTDVSLEGCLFRGNTTSSAGTSCGNSGPGGAVVVEPGSATVGNCTFEDNLASGTGGAFYFNGLPDDLLIEDSHFEGNWSGGSAGAVRAGGGVIEDCVFRANRCSGDGGGVTNGRVERCTFEGNQARRGGGTGGCDVVDSVFVGNRAIDNSFGDPDGGGAFSGTLTGCVVAGNFAEDSTGGAAVARAERCTFFGNVGSPDRAGVSGGVVDSCIVWGNTTTFPGVPVVQSAANGVVSSMVQGDPATIQGPPLFMDAARGDFRLLPGSPAIDAGSLFVQPDPDGSRADLGARPFDPTARVLIARYCEAKTTAAGCVPEAELVGLVSTSGQSAQFTVSGVPLGSSALLVASSIGDANPGFFGGTLCLGGSLVRGPIAAAAPSSGCAGVVTLPVDAALVAQVGVQAGDLLFLQAWFRDPTQPDGTGVGLSDAIVTTLQL